MNNQHIFGTFSRPFGVCKDFDCRFIGTDLNLDGSTVGVVGPKGAGQAQKPGLGVLWGERGERDEEKSDERDSDGEVEPEGKRIRSLILLWG